MSMSWGRYFFGAKGYFNVREMSDLAYLNRMLDYVHDVHSLPESCAVESDEMLNQPAFGLEWDRPRCSCDLYPYEHGGCPGPAAKRLPSGWKSGDDV